VRDRAGMRDTGLRRAIGFVSAFALAAGLAVVWAVPMAQTAFAESGDWPQFQGGPAHSGDNPDEMTISRANVSDLGISWTAGLSSDEYSSPVVSDGLVFTGAWFGSIYAYAEGCGTGGAPCEAVAEFEEPATTLYNVRTPAVADGRVFGVSADGLYAYDENARTNCSGTPLVCKPIWGVSRNSFNESFSGAPTVAGGVVYVTSAFGKLYAYDAAGELNCTGSPRTCTPLWTGITGGRNASTPTVANGVVYVAADDDKLYAFDASGVNGCTSGTCSPLWSASTGRAMSGTVSVVGGFVYAQSDKLYAFDAAGVTGCSAGVCSPRWTATLDSSSASTPAVHQGTVFVTTDKLYAFDAAGETNCSGSTCDPLWTAALPGWGSAPAIANGLVYVAGTNIGGGLSAFDAAGCDGPTCLSIWTSPASRLTGVAVAGGRLFTTDDDYLYSYGFDHGPVASLKITPQISTIVPGRSGSFHAEGFDAYGHDMGDVTADTTFALDGGSCTGSSCTATAPGDHVLRGGDGAGSGTAVVHVFSAGAADWPQFGGGSGHSGTNLSESILSKQNVGSLGLEYTLNAGTGQVAVADGMAYITALNGLKAAPAACRQNGSNCNSWSWSNGSGGGDASSGTGAAVADGVVYFTGQLNVLYAYDARCRMDQGTCTPLWQHQAGLYSSMDGTPTVWGNFVYVGSDKLYAFSRTCSTPVTGCAATWTGVVPGDFAHVTTAAAMDGVVFVGSGNVLYAFDANGLTNCSDSVCQPLWTADLGGYATAPVVAGGLVYVSSANGRLYTFDAAGQRGCGGGICTPLWHATVNGQIVTTPAVAGNRLFIGSTDGELYAFDAQGSNGCSAGACRPLWAAAAGGVGGSSPAIANGLVFIGSSTGNLYAFDAAGVQGCSSGLCSPIWAAQTGYAIGSPPTVADGRVYVTNGLSKLFVYGLNHGLLDHLVISPTSPTIAAGGTQTFTAQGFDPYNVSVGDVTANTTFSITGGGSCTRNVCTSSVAATHTVQATDGVATGSTTLKVSAGPIDHILLSPSERTAFVAYYADYLTYGYDQYGNQTGDLRYSTTLTIDGGSCVAYQCGSSIPGDHTVRATHGSLTTTGVLHVPVVDHLSINQYPMTLNADDAVTFSDHAYDAAGNNLGDATLQTTFTLTGGSCGGQVCIAEVAGDQTVTATFGSATATGILHVIGTVPSEPYGQSATSGDASASVTWVAPVRRGGSAITAYTVTASDGTHTCVWTTGPLSCAVTGLINGTTYTFTVTATNGTGTGGPSYHTNPVVPAAPTAPSKPTGVTATAASGSVSVSWSAPRVSGGSAITGYAVSSSPASAGCSTTGALFCTVTGLTIGQTYSFTVTATSSIGTSDPSDPSTPILVSGPATNFTVAGISSPHVAGTAGQLTVTALDQFGNTAVGYSGTVHFTSTDTAAILPSDTTLANGWGNFDATLNTLGTWSITVTDTVTASITGSQTGIVVESYAAATYHAIAPARVLDTRPGGGNMGLLGTFRAGTVRSFHVANAHYVGGGTGVAVPANATAVTGNLTIVGETAPGLIALGPTMTPTGDTTTLNFIKGDIRANNVTIGLNADGTLAAVFRSTTAGATTQLIFDVTGYFTPDDTGATYHSVAPGRVLDSDPVSVSTSA
jgi:outer membrane protein assembly factor BamB